MGDKKNPALIELIIVIFFFSLSATIIVQLFAASYQISRQSYRDSIAVIRAQDIIEQLKTDPVNPEKVLGNWENTKDQDGNIFTAYVDEKMNIIDKAQSTYIFVIHIENIGRDNGTLVAIHMFVYDNVANNRMIFELESSRYMSSVMGDAL